MKSLIVLIVNPAAQRASGKKVAMASYYLQSKGYDVEVHFTRKRGDAETLARESVSRRPHLIIAGGGDGTYNEVVNGIAGSGIPMAILPLGTTNVLARELDIPIDIRSAMERALRKNPALISLGKISITHTLLPLSRYFILMAGIGYDAMAVHGTSARLKKYSGQGAYIFGGMKSLLKFHPSLLTFSVDGEERQGYSAIIGNAAKYGGDFSVTPDANLSNPFLYVCIFKGRKRSDIARYVLGILRGTHLKYSDVEYLRAEKVVVTGNADIQIDGDYLGTTPATVEVVPRAFSLVY